jgi:hypothetical protein
MYCPFWDLRALILKEVKIVRMVDAMLSTQTNDYSNELLAVSSMKVQQ